MLERLEHELRNWLIKLEDFLIELRAKKVVAASGFFNKKAEKIINEYWEILQLVYDEDVLPEMRKQGYDPEQETSVPPDVWAIIVPKLKPILNLITKDSYDLLEIYNKDILQLDIITVTDLKLIATASGDDVLVMFDAILKEK